MIRVTSVATALKKALEQPISSKERKDNMVGIIDTALTQFQQNLEAGTVMLESSRDLERLVKCYVLLKSESDSPTGNSTQTPIENSKIAEILDENDPMVQTLFEKLYKGYNQINDIDK